MTGLLDCILAMPPARALMLRTQRLRLFAVPVSIAIALGGCSAPGRLSSSEASPLRYSTVHTILEADLPGAAEARLALADGFLTNGEYDDIIAASDAAEEHGYEADKAELKASAGEAGTATTVQQGVVHEHAVGNAETPQRGSHDSTT